MTDTKPEQDTSGIKEHLNSTPNILNYVLNKTNNYLILIEEPLFNAIQQLASKSNTNYVTKMYKYHFVYCIF